VNYAPDSHFPEFDWLFADTKERQESLHELRKPWLAKGICGYIAFRHADCTAILRDSRWHNSASYGIAMLGQNEGKPDSLWMAEGESHSRLRRLVAPAFSPKLADSLRSKMQSILEESIDEIDTNSQIELMTELINTYPMKVISEVLELPDGDWLAFSKWSEDMLSIWRGKAVENVGAILNAHLEMQAYTKDLIEHRRKHPGDDLVSALISAHDQDDRLDEAEMMMIIMSIIVGGSDTTRNQVGSVIATLLDHPTEWARVVNNPRLADSATDEAIRYSSITTSTSRFASEDITYRGVLFPRGTLMALSLAVANRDLDVFPDPDRFDIERTNSKQALTFGGGIHYCLAAALGRAEIQEAIRVLATRMPKLEVDGEIVWKDPGLGVHAPTSLPVRF